MLKKKRKNDGDMKREIPEVKKKYVNDLAKLMNEYPTILLVSVEGVSSSFFNELKHALKKEGIITKLIKKRLVLLAIEKSKNEKKNIEQLEQHLDKNFALLFSEKDALDIASILEDLKRPTKAKVGQIAPMDLVIESGPTDLPAGPALSELTKVKLKAGIDGGKITIKERAVLVKNGEKISKNVCDVLSLLNINPFTSGFITIAAYDSNSQKVLAGIRVDKKGMLQELLLKNSEALNLAIHINYPVKETIKILLGKANMQAQKLNLYSVQTENSLEE